MIQITTKVYRDNEYEPCITNIRTAYSKLTLKHKGRIEYEQIMKSFLKNFTVLIRNHCTEGTLPRNSLVQLNGASDNSDYTGKAYFQCNSQNAGLLVGSGNNSVTVGDYVLQNQIPNGTDSGSLVYSQYTSFLPPFVESNKSTFYVIRSFYNPSDTDSVEINEIGLTVNYQSSYSDCVTLITRDVLETLYTVSPTKNVNIAYKFVFPPPLTLQFARLVYNHMANNFRRVDVQTVDGSYTDHDDIGDSHFRVFVGEGLIAGTDTTPTSVTDYYLKNKIENGDGDNLLSYGELSVTDVTTYEDGTGFSISRPFVNNGSVSVSIGECGLVVNIGSTGYYTLIARDTFSSPITVDPGNSIIITLDIKFLL